MAEENRQPTWLWQNVVSTLLTATGSATLLKILEFVVKALRRHKEFVKDAESLKEELDDIKGILLELTTIFQDPHFSEVLKSSDATHKTKMLKILKKLEHQRAEFQKLIDPFCQMENDEDLQDLEQRLKGTATQRFIITWKNSVKDIFQSLGELNRDLGQFREEAAELIMYHKGRLSQNFVGYALSKTRYRWTNYIHEDSMSPRFTQAEIDNFNLVKQFVKFEPCHEPQYRVPYGGNLLRWYRYRHVNGSSGHVLVEPKVGAFHYSDPRLGGEDSSENLSSAYALVRQLRHATAAKAGFPKFSTLSCRGIYYDHKDLNNRQLFLVWDALSDLGTGPPRISTLLASLNQLRNDPLLLTKIAQNLVATVYQLLLARWYHRSISLEHVIAFNDDWKNPYLVGFGTARFTNGLSDPSARPNANDWGERYIQHPDRHDGKTVTNKHFRMKHDIYGLGVVLLELQKGRSLKFVSSEVQGLSTKDFQNEMVQFAEKTKTCLLGEAAIGPIVQCLNGFETIDSGFEEECQPRVLHEFKIKVFDPFEELG